jgi:hypothetical protein
MARGVFSVFFILFGGGYHAALDSCSNIPTVWLWIVWPFDAHRAIAGTVEKAAGLINFNAFPRLKIGNQFLFRFVVFY